MITVLPRSRGAWLRCSVIVAILLAVCVYRNVFSLWQLFAYHPRDGDVVFQSLPHGELVDAIEGVTNSPWSHCGVLVYEHHCWFVVEAIVRVRKTPLPLWIMRGRKGYFEVYRPTISLPPGDEPLHAALNHYLDRPYDYHYAPGEDEIYCSELVYDAYRNAFGVKLGEWQALGALNWKPYERFIRWSEDGTVPLERPIITPAGLTRSPLLRRVYPKISSLAGPSRS
jgi:Permuted papain-like amidase enzyme, YaeF/YiiX, C92 family